MVKLQHNFDLPEPEGNWKRTGKWFYLIMFSTEQNWTWNVCFSRGSMNNKFLERSAEKSRSTLSFYGSSSANAKPLFNSTPNNSWLNRYTANHIWWKFNSNMTVKPLQPGIQNGHHENSLRTKMKKVFFGL